MEIKLLSNNDFVLADEEVSSKMFLEYDKKSLELRHLFIGDGKLTQEVLDKELQFTFIINNYEYIYPAHIRDSEKRKMTIEQLTSARKIEQSIVYYRPNSIDYFPIWEIIKNFIKRPPKSVLEFSNNFCLIDALHNYEKKTWDEDIKYQLIYPNKYVRSYSGKMTTEDEIKKYVSIPKAQYQIISDELTPDYNLSGKYDLISTDITFYDVQMRNYFYDFYNLPLHIAVLILSVKLLNLGGQLIFNPLRITKKFMADLILIIGSMFDRFDLYQAEFVNAYKSIGTYVIFSGFKGINQKVIDQLNEIYSKVKKFNFNVTNEEIRQLRMVTKPITSHQFPKSIMENADYQLFHSFNEKVFFDKNVFIQKLIDLFPKKLTDKDIELINEDRLMMSIVYARKFDHDHRDFVKSDNYDRLVNHYIFGAQEPTMYRFRYGIANKYVGIPKSIIKLKDKKYLADHILDTRNLADWDRLKEFRLYASEGNPSLQLKKYVEKNYGTNRVSQAWLKMYEILDQIPGLLKKASDSSVKTFHLCEAPGMFISATNHYIKTKMGGATFDWIAQSLNPKMRPDAFGDDYGFMKKYPNKWNWGKDGTGNITNPENIAHYGKLIHPETSLITSDCGIDLGSEPNLDFMIKITAFSLFFMIVHAPLGCNFVQKIYSPICSFRLIIGLIYFAWLIYGRVIFYKPVINVNSQEFYIIGLNKQQINENLLSELTNRVLRAIIAGKINEDLFPDNFNDVFITQLDIGLNRIVNQYIQNRYRELYIVDNLNSFGSEFFKIIKKYIVEKNREWCEDHNLAVIDSKDIL